MSVLDGPGEGTWSVFAAKVVEERDEARADFANACDVGRRQEARAEKAGRERDELRAQLAFLREEYGVNADNGTLTRDALEQKIQVLLHERRQLRARLVECRPWVGVCPFPNQPGFDEMLAIRDLTDDTLKEVGP